ncbi:MAG: DUF4276 family protein [Bacteroidota bacterium]|nr:DUF4276 family protein [Bacteroidota bacterium]
MSSLVCLLEEPSAREMLEGVLPRILPENISVHYIIFEGKQDLEKQVERKLRLWQKPDSLFLVMRDQDAGDCVVIKDNLIRKINRSGKSDTAMVRIACRELESFYLGDLQAVEYGIKVNGLADKQNSRKYREPDSLVNAAQELVRLSGKQYQKVAGSRAIGPCLRVGGENKSHSFNVLVNGIKKLVGSNS